MTGRSLLGLLLAGRHLHPQQRLWGSASAAAAPSSAARRFPACAQQQQRRRRSGDIGGVRQERLLEKLPSGKLPAVTSLRALDTAYNVAALWGPLRRACRRHELENTELYPYVVASEAVQEMTRLRPPPYFEADVVVDFDQTRSGGAPRTPVVALLGHVDHGKTTLLDAWAGSKRVDEEPGHITQDIRAYNVRHAGHSVTVVDTPGHKLFGHMREHGSLTCDAAVVVVDLTKGVQGQTKETLGLALDMERPFVVALTKVDLIPPEQLKETVAQVKRALKKEGVAVSVRTAQTAGSPLAEGEHAAVPVSGLHGIQTDLLLAEVVAAAGATTASASATPTAVIVDVLHRHDRLNGVHRQQEAAPLDAAANASVYAGRREEYNAAFAPDMTEQMLRSTATTADVTLSCIARGGVFAPQQAFLAGREGHGVVRALMDEHGRPVSSVRPGEAFLINVTLSGGFVPEFGSHLLGIASTGRAHAVLQHRRFVSEYLRAGGSPSLLTPERSDDAYYWLQASVAEKAEEEQAGDALDVNDLEVRGLICNQWLATLACGRPDCRKAHPENLHVEPPVALRVALAAGTRGSLNVLVDIVKAMRGKSVDVKIVHKIVGVPTIDDVNLVTAQGPYIVPMISYRVRLPVHAIPVAVSQKLDVYELELFSDVMRRIDVLAESAHDEWARKQRARWARFRKPEKPIKPRKTSRAVRAILAEVSEGQTLHNIYADADANADDDDDDDEVSGDAATTTTTTTTPPVR